MLSLFYIFLKFLSFLLYYIEKARDIFLYIEKKMDVVVPAYIKNILKCCGYDNCHTLATIKDSDIEYFADEVRKGKITNFYHDKISSEAIMEGCMSTVENFVFSRGHIQLLKAIVKMVTDTLDVHGVDGFLLKLPKNSLENSLKLQNKDHILKAAATSVYRKRFKFSTVSSTRSQDNDQVSCDDAISPIQNERSTLIRKAILSLITHSPKLFANVVHKH